MGGEQAVDRKWVTTTQVPFEPPPSSAPSLAPLPFQSTGNQMSMLLIITHPNTASIDQPRKVAT